MLILVVSTFTLLYDSFLNRPPGDYEVERGDIYLSDGDYDAALALFDEDISPFNAIPQGYAIEEFPQEIHWDTDWTLLKKPFNSKQLADAIERAMTTVPH